MGLLKEGRLRLAAALTAGLVAAAAPGAASVEAGNGFKKPASEGPIATTVIKDGTKSVTTVPCFPDLAQPETIFCPGGAKIITVVGTGEDKGQNYLRFEIGNDSSIYLNRASSPQLGPIVQQESPTSVIEVINFAVGQKLSVVEKRTGPDGVAVYDEALPKTAFDQKAPCVDASNVPAGWICPVDTPAGEKQVILLPNGGNNALTFEDDSGPVPVTGSIPNREIAGRGVLVDLKGGKGSFLLLNIATDGRILQASSSYAGNSY